MAGYEGSCRAWTFAAWAEAGNENGPGVIRGRPPTVAHSVRQRKESNTAGGRDASENWKNPGEGGRGRPDA